MLHFFVPSGMTIEDPAAFAPPPSFGPFRVLHQIGIGALGPVFRTYEPTRDRLVAVKVFRLDVTPEQSQLLADELAKASDAGLFHPSIVEPIASGVEGTVAYRAEEYVAAESLDAAIRHYAPASLDKALPFLTQLAGAIDFARTAGIGHGALHLRDIFVTPEEARASGFGVVEALERVGIRAPVRRPYSAPERIAGEEWSTPADVFSLAAITYELLTGRRPSGTGEQLGPLTGDHLLEFGAGMRVVLARAMDDDPARRYPSALAFASALEAAAHGGRISEAVSAVGVISGATRRGADESAAGPLAAASSAHPSAPQRAVPSQADPAAEDDLPLAAEVDDTAAPDLGDIAAERDEDAAHFEISRMAHADDDRERTLFDDESHDDLMAAGAYAGAAASAASRPRFADTEDDASETYAKLARTDYAPSSSSTDAERPRPAALPLAVTLILGLLIGFAAGYWTGGRAPARVATGAPAGAADPAGSTAPAAGRRDATPAGTQPVAEPSLVPPAIPDEEPPTGASRSAAAAPAAAPTPTATTGRLVVTSTPSRASVTIDGRWRGRTPLRLDKVKLGKYSLRVVAPGFAVSREEVTLTTAAPSRTVALRLEREAPAARAPASPPGRPARQPERPAARATPSSAFTGSVYVDSRPRGARILIDGRLAGTTPARIPDVAIGSHVVRLELAEHRAWTVSIRVAAEEETRVTGSLERIP